MWECLGVIMVNTIENLTESKMAWERELWAHLWGIISAVPTELIEAGRPTPADASFPGWDLDCSWSPHALTAVCSKFWMWCDQQLWVPAIATSPPEQQENKWWWGGVVGQHGFSERTERWSSQREPMRFLPVTKVRRQNKKPSALLKTMPWEWKEKP